MNKILKIPIVIAKYDGPLAQKTPYAELTMDRRKDYWIQIIKNII